MVFFERRSHGKSECAAASEVGGALEGERADGEGVRRGGRRQGVGVILLRRQLSAAEPEGSDGRYETAEQSVRSQPTPCAKPGKRSATPLPRFVELPMASVASAPAMLELLLGDVRVRVPSGFDEETLTRVVRALGVAR
jgi:hypothetical protein